MSYYLYIHNIYLYQYHDTKPNSINIDWLLWLTPTLKFVKNDSIGCRVVCKSREKEDCTFLAFYSQVSGQHTYMIKTWDGDHTCLKVGKNRFATSKWVTKAVVLALMSNENLRVTAANWSKN